MGSEMHSVCNEGIKHSLYFHPGFYNDMPGHTEGHFLYSSFIFVIFRFFL
jgi:hypothetical protein